MAQIQALFQPHWLFQWKKPFKLQWVHIDPPLFRRAGRGSQPLSRFTRRYGIEVGTFPDIRRRGVRLSWRFLTAALLWRPRGA